MFSAILSGLVQWLLKVLFHKSTPSDAERAGIAETEVKQEEAASDLQAKAAVARGDATARVVRSIANKASDADANAELKKRFPGTFRD